MQEGQDSPGEPPNPAPYAQPCSAPQQYFGSSLIFFYYYFFLLHASLGKVPHFKKSIERHHSSCQQRMQSRIYRAGWECCADPLLCQ